jgi:divalent metal cation (Fe/Co/Zn/Cd) transporter
MPVRAATIPLDRAALVRRGRVLSLVTIGYNALEGIVAIASGILAGSVSLLGFGVDSLIEVASGGTALWRLTADVDAERREHVERQSLRVIGALFLALAAYVAFDAVKSLWLRERPEESYFGIAIAIASVIVMPTLARAKRKVARGLSSRALDADATQTDLCMYLSAILLSGLVLNALFGWWWADPVAAICMSPIIAREGWEALRGEPPCDNCQVQ